MWFSWLIFMFLQHNLKVIWVDNLKVIFVNNLVRSFTCSTLKVGI